MTYGMWWTRRSMNCGRRRPVVDQHPITDLRVQVPFLLPGPTKHHALQNRDIVPDLCRLPNHHSGGVIEQHPFLYSSVGVDVDPLKLKKQWMQMPLLAFSRIFAQRSSTATASSSIRLRVGDWDWVWKFLTRGTRVRCENKE
ncbi:unnamed protein product [Linum trigynum]|uniref:Uncharacterized protein n=1 Tax=Linum trigynum TaxID=586398 RepID=A0AAV2G9N7_9ROSI